MSEQGKNKKSLSHSMVHYLLTVHKLKEDKGYARVTDIAKSLGLTKGSVSTALSNLKKKGLILEDQDSKFLSLSEKGHKEVHEILSSRTLLFYFLRDILKVSEQFAHRDSCLMEHLICQETRECFFNFMKTFSSTEGIAHNELMKTNVKFNSSLDLSNYNSSDEFEKGQKGDSYLK